MSANQFEKKSEAWSALFSEPTSELVQRYTASVTFDKRLWRADIAPRPRFRPKARPRCKRRTATQIMLLPIP